MADWWQGEGVYVDEFQAVGEDVDIYNQRYYLEQGPVDPTDLYDQPNHRSRDVWNDHPVHTILHHLSFFYFVNVPSVI
ncbi:unnamed protein product [Linum tenue]|uniref:Uncharacterized protein n=2 Tax=Linum tenue TaxID=586396 RepID=A0AAV0P899_9ROSI|nr:unnamed protein product [Linum tenue]